MSNLSVSNEDYLNLKEYSNTNFELEKNIISDSNNNLENESENLNLEINKNLLNRNEKDVNESLKLVLELTNNSELLNNNNLTNIENSKKIQNKYVDLGDSSNVQPPTVSNENTIVTDTLNEIVGNNKNNKNNSNNYSIRNELMSIFPLSIIIMLIIFLLLLIYVISYQ